MAAAMRALEELSDGLEVNLCNDRNARLIDAEYQPVVDALRRFIIAWDADDIEKSAVITGLQDCRAALAKLEGK